MWFPVYLKGPVIPDPGGQRTELIVYVTSTIVNLQNHQILLTQLNGKIRCTTWRGALMISLICVWLNGWVNNHEAGRAHYGVTVMHIVKSKTRDCRQGITWNCRRHGSQFTSRSNVWSLTDLTINLYIRLYTLRSYGSHWDHIQLFGHRCN